MYPHSDIFAFRPDVNGGDDIVIVRGRAVFTDDHPAGWVALLEIELGETKGLLGRGQRFAEPYVSDEAAPFIFGQACMSLLAIEVHVGGGRWEFADAGTTRQKGRCYQGQVGEE